MTISLAAVFIPLVFMPGLVGRIFREFAITIVVSIFASGLVSLTLTPLMCARLLEERGAGAKRTWMERVIGGDRAARAAAFMADRSVGSCGTVGSRRLIWVVCLAGTVVLFHARAQSVSAAGRQQRRIFGVFIAREGSSPEQMHAHSGTRRRSAAA